MSRMSGPRPPNDVRSRSGPCRYLISEASVREEQECWHPDPSARPPFSEIDRRIRALDADGGARRRGRAKSVDNSGLPPHVVATLARGEKVAPEHKDMVSVYFSDIVGFTTISSTLSSAQVSDMLDRLYLRFDTLADQLGVYKIETIGDAYLAATNLWGDMAATHAAHMARFALGAVQAAQEVLVDPADPSRGGVRIRVGLASGPVTATLIGTRNPKYTLLGDTMNTASRMESNSIPCRVQCTEATADLIRAQDSDVVLQARGELEIKGKGRMRTVWVCGLASEGCDAAAFAALPDVAGAAGPTASAAPNPPAANRRPSKLARLFNNPPARYNPPRAGNWREWASISDLRGARPAPEAVSAVARPPATHDLRRNDNQPLLRSEDGSNGPPAVQVSANGNIADVVDMMEPLAPDHVT